MADEVSDRSMTESELEQMAQTYLAILAGRDLGAADTIFSPDMVWRFGASPAQTGLQAWKELVVQWLTAFPDLAPIETAILVDVPRQSFAVRMRWTATHCGAFLDVAATGRAVVNEGVLVFCVRNGRIVDEWIFEDLAALLQQISGPSAQAQGQGSEGYRSSAG